MSDTVEMMQSLERLVGEFDEHYTFLLRKRDACKSTFEAIKKVYEDALAEYNEASEECEKARKVVRSLMDARDIMKRSDSDDCYDDNDDCYF